MGMTGEQAYVLAKKLIEAGGGGGGTVDAYTKTQTDNLLNQKVDKEVLNNIISDEWNDKTTYEVGKYCIYANKLWKCLVQHSSQTPTEGTYWTQTSIDDEITELNSNIKNTLDSIINIEHFYVTEQIAIEPKGWGFIDITEIATKHKALLSSRILSYALGDTDAHRTYFSTFITDWQGRIRLNIVNNDNDAIKYVTIGTGIELVFFG